MRQLLASLLLLLGLALPLHASEPAIPESVLRLARAYAAAHPGELMPPGRSLARAYADGFFQGFTNAGFIEASGSRVLMESFARGRARWREGPIARKRTFLEFGYQPIGLSGVWVQGFESKLFRPNGAAGGYWWWDLPDAQIDLPREPPPLQPGEGVREYRVRVTGFLSPPGRYGHQGVADRQLFVQSARLAGE